MMPRWIKNIAPDVAETLTRFPLAIFLSLSSTLVAVALTNNLVTSANLDFWFRLGFGLSVGAVFAVAGVFYGESRGKSGAIHLVLAFAFPFFAVAFMQVESTTWVVAPMLAPISLLWLSVSPFTHIGAGQERKTIQDKFWWLNHRAITTAVIAGVGFGLIALGFVAVERAIAVLFGVRSSRLFYEILLPFTGLFLTPVYWLSTLPKIEDFSPDEISEPDFLSRAVGFLGQFILTPFLFIYALILLAYALQILITQSLPQGMLSWMVLGFVIVGAANYLVLHPDFMHKRLLVRYFRKTWFWLTLIPIALYVMGVWVRIENYGLTEERVGLIAGGVWMVGLTLALLSKKHADIRLIPTLALVAITLFSVGPWNFINLPKINQAMRLDTALANATPITQSIGGPYEWTQEEATMARGAIRYLERREERWPALVKVLERHGLPGELVEKGSFGLFAELELQTDDPQLEIARRRIMNVLPAKVSDVSKTPFYNGQAIIIASNWLDINNLSFGIVEDNLVVKGVSQLEQSIGLSQWIERQTGETITEPKLEFTNSGQNYLFVIESISFVRSSSNADNWVPLRIEAVLFSENPPPNNLPPVNLTNQ